MITRIATFVLLATIAFQAEQALAATTDEASRPASRRGATTTQPDSSALQQCTDLMLQSVTHAQQVLPQMSATADVVARRWIAGADLFIGGDASFSDEAFYRAGGLIGLRRIGPARKSNGRTMPLGDVPKESIVLYGLHRHADASPMVFEDLGHLAADKDTVVLFASQEWPITQKVLQVLKQTLPDDRLFLVDTHLPVDTRLRTRGGAPFGSYAGMGTATHTWTFMAELIAACTRQGKMPGAWPSLTIPRYEIWEKKYETMRFHDDFTIAPIELGVLGGQYLQTLRRQLQACPASAGQVNAAARLLAGVPAGRTVYLMTEGHLLPAEVQLPMELANWVQVQRSDRWPQAAQTIEKGDGILWLGYLAWPDEQAGKAIEQGNPFVGVSVRGPGERFNDEPLVTPGVPPSSQPAATTMEAARPSPTTLPASIAWVHAPWQYPDSVVEIPGYPVKACPTSAVVQGTLLWGLIGEVMERR